MRAENPDHQKRPIRQPTIDLLRQQLHKGQVNTTLHSLRGLRLPRSLRSGFVSSTQPYPVFFSTASPFSPTVGWLVTFILILPSDDSRNLTLLVVQAKLLGRLSENISVDVFTPAMSIPEKGSFLREGSFLEYNVCTATRKPGAKKAQSVSISEERAKALKNRADP